MNRVALREEHPGLRASRAHIERMTGPLGLYQHADGRRPALAHGYCTDDNARMLTVDVRHARRWPAADLSASLDRDMRFLEEAFSLRTGRFRNLRGVDGEWLDDAGTPDSHGRAIQALGWTVSRCDLPEMTARAARLLSLALPAALEMHDPRPLAYVALGCLAAARVGVDARMLAAVRDVVGRLARLASAGNASWPWPEDTVTYDNGVLPQALIQAGTDLARPDLLDLGVQCLTWLITAQVAEGHLRPVGNHGWWPRGGSPARYDQQPIEAASLLEAAAAGYRATADLRWRELASVAFTWFLGGNDRGESLADLADGSCRDGLGESGANENRGAESTLAWLMSVETMVESGIWVHGHG